MKSSLYILYLQPDSLEIDSLNTINQQDSLSGETFSGTDSIDIPIVDTVEQIANQSIPIVSEDTVIQDEPPATPPVRETIQQPKVNKPSAEQSIETKPPEKEESKQLKSDSSKNFLTRIPDYASNTNAVKNIFQTNTHHEKTLKVLPHKVHRDNTPDWFAGILLLSGIFLIWVRNYYTNYLSLILRSFGNYQFSIKLFKDSSALYKQVSSLLNINSAFIMGLFLYQVYTYFDMTQMFGSSFFVYLSIPGILLAIYVLQYAGYYLLGVIVDNLAPFMEFAHHSFTLTKILGLVFLPLVLSVAYISTVLKPFIIWMGLGILAVFYIKRLFRGGKIINMLHVFKFQWILYFCTLEILPVLVIIKLAKSLI